MKRFGITFLVSAASAILPAQAQTPPAVVVPAKIISVPATPAKAARPGDSDDDPIEEANREPGKPAAANAKSDKPKTAEESPRLKKFRELKYDRRPSAALKNWAEPQAKPDPNFVGPIQPVEPLDLEVQTLQKQVALGNWPGVKAYFASIPLEEARAGYRLMLASLGRGVDMQEVMRSGGNPQMAQWSEKFVFSADDLIGIAAAAPAGTLDREALSSLGSIMNQGLASGTVMEAVLDRFTKEAAKTADQATLTRRQVARLLVDGNKAAEAGPFLPAVDQAKKEEDVEGLNLLAQHFLALNARDKKAVDLEKAWTATQAVLGCKIALPDEKLTGLKLAVELAPRLKQELGQTWLDASFTSQIDRGKEILATLGSLASQGLASKPFEPDQRAKELLLMKTAVESLVKAAPATAKEWQAPLNLIATAWFKEADFSRQFARSTSLTPGMRRDRFGNIYYMNQDFDEDGPQQMMQQRQGNMPQPIKVGEVLEAQPSDGWLALVSFDLQPKIDIVRAQLYLKVNEEAKSLPIIEKLASTHPEPAKNLVKEFLRIWTKNHDPNESRRNTNPYMFMFGFEQRAAGIPLTRSRQERNLVDLAEVIARLRKLPIGEPDEELLANAFTSSHSSAEVYKLDAIENVLGPVASLQPKTLSGLAQKMRENLGGLWRKPSEQKDKKTNRKQKDIEAEVMRGYAVARSVVENAQGKYPADWSLQAAHASLLHDEINFRQELAKSSNFGPGRLAALSEFQKAAELYAAKVAELPEEAQSTAVYEQWFYASLGAVDLAQLRDDMLPDVRQPALIRAAMLKLPGELAEKHVTKFANGLFTRMSAVNPACKFTYLKGGFEIVGDHKQAHEARKVYDYYKDLVREIRLETVVDGSSSVGNGKPFGVFVNLKHTREIERESGGFGKYLQNQNSMMFAYNYGRPNADYRDKFQQAATEVLKEQFDVVSMTFQPESVHSRADREYGWRTTPYCYMLLKAKGPQVDKIPSLRIDLDFLDTSGYVVLPIESAALPIDAKSSTPPSRPAQKVAITQTLDERQASQGKLVLDVKASGRGLMPELEELIDLKPDGFEIAKVDDQGVSVAKYDQEGEETAPLTERNIVVTLQGRKDLKELPTRFTFGKPKVPTAEVTYQRFVDADLVPVPTPEIALDAKYGQVSNSWKWYAIPLGLAALAGLAALIAWMRKPIETEEPKYRMPEKLTPFSVIGLLRTIDERNGLSAERSAELQATIRQIEKHYFADEPGSAPDLQGVAERWLAAAR